MLGLFKKWNAAKSLKDDNGKKHAKFNDNDLLATDLDEIREIHTDADLDAWLDEGEVLPVVHKLAKNSEIESLRRYLSKNAVELLTTDENGWTALSFAIVYGDGDTFAMLLEQYDRYSFLNKVNFELNKILAKYAIDMSSSREEKISRVSNLTLLELYEDDSEDSNVKPALNSSLCFATRTLSLNSESPTEMVLDRGLDISPFRN